MLVLDEDGEFTKEQFEFLKRWGKPMNQQAQMWAGDFGDEYAKRSPGSVPNNRVFFLKALGAQIVSGQINSVIEFGAGVGSNLLALRERLPKAHIAAVEINPHAMEGLIATQAANEMHQSSMLDWINPTPGQYDLAFTKGVLIHIPEDDLPRAYAALHAASRRYILIAEYYAPKRTEIEYRGRRDMLWKDDFAGAMLYRYEDLKLVNYGFVYHLDEHPQDDLNWFLLEKRA